MYVGISAEWHYHLYLMGGMDVSGICVQNYTNKSCDATTYYLHIIDHIVRILILSLD